MFHVTIHVMETVLKNFIEDWNQHHIPGPGGGIPNTLAIERNNATHLLSSDIPSTSQMVALHEQSGNRLCRDGAYGHDPLLCHPQLQSLQERDHATMFPDMGVVFQNILHDDAELFRSCVYHFIHLTNSLAQLVE